MMIKQLASSVAALSLMLAAAAGSPAWSAAKTAVAGKCHHSKARPIKSKPVAAKAQPARGVMLVDQRKHDIQILSFGP